MGWAIDWLPDGGLLVSGEDLAISIRTVQPRYSEQGGNEVVVDPAGHVYINGADFDFPGGGEPDTRVDPADRWRTARPTMSPATSSSPTGW